MAEPMRLITLQGRLRDKVLSKWGNVHGGVLVDLILTKGRVAPLIELYGNVLLLSPKSFELFAYHEIIDILPARQ